LREGDIRKEGERENQEPPHQTPRTLTAAACKVDGICGNREGAMSKGRLEAFSDGVIAIIITIMVLELKVPHGVDLLSLRPLIPVLLSYVLSFVFLGSLNNHHHLFQAAKVDNSVPK
jgi:hypothetical protein